MSTDRRQILWLLLIIAQAAHGADWPMWRYDALRSGASPHDLPDRMNLRWVRRYGDRQPVWDEPLNRDLMPYDRVFEPVVRGKTVFVPFNDSDKLVALDTNSGTEQWAFYTDGPVRLPPVAWRDKVYFVSDDGNLYCVGADGGELIWKQRGGPSPRRNIGNNRMISTWPARGGPVIKDEVVYFAASIWPFMGTFIHAREATTGAAVWVNDHQGSKFIQQPHNSPSFAGVAPQGALVASGDKLFVPGGRSVPAVFDRATGRQLYYHLAQYGKTGGSSVYAANDLFLCHERAGAFTMFDASTGDRRSDRRVRQPVLTTTTVYTSGDAVRAYRLDDLENALWEVQADAAGDLIKAGRRLYAGGTNRVTIIEEADDHTSAQVVATIDLDGTVGRLVAGDDKLFAVTTDGAILAFGAEDPAATPASWAFEPAVNDLPPSATEQAATILDRTGVREGYALFFGVGDGDLLEAVAQQSALHLIAVDRDTVKIERLRRRYDAAGLYGTRIALHYGDPATFTTAPYFSSLTIIGDLDGAGDPASAQFVAQVHHAMRPYGGKAWLPIRVEERAALAGAIQDAGLRNIGMTEHDGAVVLERAGPLEGAADWTHQYGDIANTIKSDDQLVRLPLGILWFGGSSNMDVLPRHGHGPSEQIIGGRNFIQGIDSLSARDVYTGRVLWKVKLDTLGTRGVYYDSSYANTPLSTAYNQVHIAGANARGTNFVATEESVYVVQGADCRVLDAATGAAVNLIRLPATKANQPPKEWGYIGVYEDYLIGGADFSRSSSRYPQDDGNAGTGGLSSSDKMASNSLVVMNRHTGETIWRIDGTHGFLHNGIAVGQNTLFCLDKLPSHVEKRFERRGQELPEGYRLRALDIHTGNVKWKLDDNVFGSWLSYSKQHHVLMQATRPSRDMIAGEDGSRMIVHRVRDGSVLWDKAIDYGEPPILHGSRIIAGGRMIDLLSGQAIDRRDPLTGKEAPWSYARGYGCNYAIASEHLLTFRAAAAGFFDLAGDGGTGHFGGFRTGCTTSLVAANGVLNAPDYTRTCSCSYQNQTSLALVHMPDIEVWTHNDFDYKSDAIRRLGINFAAAGDRRSAQSTLWLDYPAVGGPSPEVPVQINGEPTYFRRHASRVDGPGLSWVASSGLLGAVDITLTLIPASAEGDESGASDRDPDDASAPDALYTVHLTFLEPQAVESGQRVFSVAMQDRTVLPEFDIVSRAGTIKRSIVMSFQGVRVKNDLKISLTPLTDRPAVICGIEVVAE